MPRYTNRIDALRITTSRSPTMIPSRSATAQVIYRCDFAVCVAVVLLVATGVADAFVDCCLSEGQEEE